MKLVESILEHKRLVLLCALALALMGALAAATMPRQEDSRIDDYWGLVVTPFPGADAEKIERLVVDPIEEHLAEVEEVKEVKTTMRSGVAVTFIELNNYVESVDDAWDEVRRSLAKAKKEFPDSAGEPELDEKMQDPDSVLLAVTGSGDPVKLKDAAKSIKKDLLAIPQVSRVRLIADPKEQITVEFDDSLARRLGVDALVLAKQLSARNLTVPGGSVKSGGKNLILRLNDEFESVGEISRTPILLPSGAAIPLGELARVRRGPEEPASERMRFDGRTAVGLGVVPRKGINLVTFGESIRTKLAELRPQYAPLEIAEVTFQPDRVSARLANLGQSFLMSVAIVAAVLFAFMGIRLGLVVASIVPLVTLASLAIFNWGGGILHQISIAAFVVAMGMLVDNAIVVAESVQQKIDHGEDRQAAALASVKELAIPLAAATGTTLAAFLPMLMAKSTTAEFTSALPAVIMITLTVSYVFAVAVTPILSAFVLKPRLEKKRSILARFGSYVSVVSIRWAPLVLVSALVVVGAALFASRWVDKNFFPCSDRNQLVVDMKLPEGAHLDEIDHAAARVERELMKLPHITSYASFMGRSAPQFYYNMPRRPNSPHLAQVVVNTVDLASVATTMESIRKFAANELPEVELVARRLEQGPPLDAPVEVKVIGKDPDAVGKTADLVLAKLREVPEAVDVRHNLGLGVPTIRFEIDDASAARHGLSRSDVARVVQGRTRGLLAGTYKAGEDPVPILIRSEAGEDYRTDHLLSVEVAPPGGKPVPLAQLAHSKVEWLPAVIHHLDRKRVVTVSAQLAEGATYSQALDKGKPKLAELKLPAGIKLEDGGAVAESDEANTALFAALPIGLVALVLILTAEFNSIRRVMIILVTVPLAATGVIPGLLLAHQPFGFQSLLGVFALAGVVVNNAIVLVDRIDIRRREGDAIDDAISEAVQLRTRPILLTTATTVMGLLPLAFSSSNLWPPLAWAMISGLIGSTVLTLVVVPSMYRTLFRQSAI